MTDAPKPPRKNKKRTREESIAHVKAKIAEIVARVGKYPWSKIEKPTIH